ncbi:hypothetical protein [Oleomonas cavernae]|nr:hypothetical protein [Oleomonas cavernae]
MIDAYLDDDRSSAWSQLDEIDPSIPLNLRFSRPDGSVAAIIRGDPQASVAYWELLADNIRLSGTDDRFVAFGHFEGGNCCGRVEVFRLGETPHLFASTPWNRGEREAIVKTAHGWVATTIDSSMDRNAFRGHPGTTLTLMQWRLTAAGFVIAPELGKASSDGTSELSKQCEMVGGWHGPRCSDYFGPGMTDGEMADQIRATVARAKGDGREILERLPNDVVAAIGSGRASRVFDSLAAAGAPPMVSRVLAQLYLQSPYWPEVVKLNSLATMLGPLTSNTPVIAEAIARDRLLWPLSVLGGPVLGLLEQTCGPVESRQRLLDADGGELASSVAAGCPRIQATTRPDDVAGAMAVHSDGRRDLFILTRQGGLVIHRDGKGWLSLVDNDQDGRADEIHIYADKKIYSCPLTDAAGTMDCVDQFRAAE